MWWSHTDAQPPKSSEAVYTVLYTQKQTFSTLCNKFRGHMFIISYKNVEKKYIITTGVQS